MNNRIFIIVQIKVFEHIGATLWDPLELIEANGGTPPLTYAQFCHVTRGVNKPPRPLEDVDLQNLNFVELPNRLQTDLKCFPTCPTPQDLGVSWNGEQKVYGVSLIKCVNYLKGVRVRIKRG